MHTCIHVHVHESLVLVQIDGSLYIIRLLGHEPPLVEWEYLPYVGPRQAKGFVGLKNAGATCYMNAVLQQVSVQRSDSCYRSLQLHLRV